jgi:hypothetical protein
MLSRPLPDTEVDEEAKAKVPAKTLVNTVTNGSLMDGPRSEKPLAKRLKEVVELLGKLTGELGIPLESPEVQELKGHLDAYVRDGLCWSGTVSFEAWDHRVAHVVLPKSATKPIEVVLKKRYAFKRK